MRLAIIRLTYLAIALIALQQSVVRGADRGNSTDQPAAPAQNVEQAKLLVQQALEAEVQGRSDRRAALLAQARKLDPNLAIAHWHSGDVKLDGKWVAFDAPSQDPQRVAKLDEYRQRRDQAQNIADDQRQLARWCEKVGLSQEAQTHWRAVLALDRSSVEARSKLGLVYYHKQLMPASEVEAFDADLKKQQEDYLKWKDRFVKMRSQIENKQTAAEALQELRGISDPRAIPAMEAVFAKGKTEAAAAAVESLSKMPDVAATQSLVRFAVFSPSAEVRQAAAKALRPRSLYAYVPQLIAGLDTPISVQFERYQTPNGSLGYQMSLFKENPWGDKMYTSTGVMDNTWYPSAVARMSARMNANLPSGWTPGTVVVKSDPEKATAKVAKAEARAEQRANQALAQNDDIAASNERIISVLRTATGKDFGSDSIAWFNWWNDYNEYDRPQKRPTRYAREETYSSPYTVAAIAPAPPYVPPGPTGGRNSCFAAGTPVWTISGLVQIEKVRPGDWVLAQDAATGELGYKPVTDATVRSPSSLIKIQAGDTLIRCTAGHPMWVSGVGWKMAKEINAGDWLHTIRGPMLIEAVESEKDPSTGYNLVVADFDSYFVGKAMVLVHDNNLRKPTDAVVPGLARQ